MHAPHALPGRASCDRNSGGSTFAEDPQIAAPDARLLWLAEFDPTTLSVTAVPGDPTDPDRIDVALLAPWLSLVTDLTGREHAVLSDGRHHLRVDIDSGSLASGGAVVLHYHIQGVASAEPKLLSLRRLIDLCKHRRFAAHLFPADPRIDRWLLALRVSDALSAGASHRDIANELYGADRVGSGWHGEAESLRLRVRRLARDARILAGGGYRALMRRGRWPSA